MSGVIAQWRQWRHPAAAVGTTCHAPTLVLELNRMKWGGAGGAERVARVDGVGKEERNSSAVVSVVITLFLFGGSFYWLVSHSPTFHQRLSHWRSGRKLRLTLHYVTHTHTYTHTHTHMHTHMQGQRNGMEALMLLLLFVGRCRVC